VNYVTSTNKVKALTTKLIEDFQETILRHYYENGRDLPWRKTNDPYEILVSEIMLQQTQVQRVMQKYDPFLRSFPDFQSLAKAHLRDVLALWKGLGYNRRAMSLQRIAVRVVREFQSRLPDSEETLRTLPGIGQATAGALMAFAFRQPTAFIETNIRRVFLHFFFPQRNGVRDKEILPLVEKTVDRSDVRRWYYALMDYGVMLKTQTRNPNQRSAHYQRQARFRGSDREIRGMILSALLDCSPASEADVLNAIGKPPERVKRMVKDLVREGFLESNKGLLRISSGSDGNRS
jgi:A/G-specific adenine glycosylase